MYIKIRLNKKVSKYRQKKKVICLKTMQHFFVDNVRRFIGVVAISITIEYFKTSLAFNSRNNSVNVYGRIFHPYGNNIIVLRMESQIGGGGMKVVMT